MECNQAKPLFSELLERALPPAESAQVSVHIAACASCRQELDLLRRTIRALRDVPREEPPAGLFEAIAARIVVPPVEPLLPPAPGERRLLSGEPWRLPWLLAAAALLLVAVSVGLIAWREAAWQERVAERDRRLVVLDEERASTVREMRALEAGRDILRRELESTRAGVAGDRVQLEEQLTRLRAEAATRESEKRIVDERLADCGRESQALASRVERMAEAIETLQAAAAAAAKEPPPAGIAAEKKPADDGAPAVGGELAEAPPEAPQVLFLGQDGAVELRIRGTRDEVIPQLLHLAGDAAREEHAELALQALEGFLGRPAPEAGAAGAQADQGAANGRRWWQRPALGLADAVGLSGDEAEAAPRSPYRDRQSRLRALEQAWEREIAARAAAEATTDNQE